MIKKIQRACKFCGKIFNAYPENVRRGNGNFCSRSCSCRYTNRRPIIGFESSYIPEPNTGCWLWIKGRMGNTREKYRYPAIKLKGKMYLAHRHSLEQKLGRKLLDNMCACHKCDTPLCVNPEHLFEGTRKDNQQDSIKKGRHWSQK
jgi:hypothetical protein